MLRNYFKVGWRNLARQKMYSFIKIGGLSLGIAACLLISLFLNHELSYDKNYPDVDRLYRVIGVYNIQDETVRAIYFPAPLADVLKADFPEIEASGRFLASELLGSGTALVRKEENPENFYEDNLVFADQELLNLMQPSFVYGNIHNALSAPNTIALSERMAEKYFPGINPVGKILILNNDNTSPCSVGGVFRDFPSNSHFNYNMLISLTGREFWPGEQTFWKASNYHTYIKVRPGTNVSQLEKKLKEGIVNKYMLSSWLDAEVVDAEERAKNVFIELQPVSDIHLYSSGIHDGLQHGDIRFVWMFGAIAGLILIIACVNFVNLSTAKSANRAREVGLRKVAGSLRINLINQFLVESVLFSLLSFILAFLLAWASLPYFNMLTGQSLTFPWNEWWFFPLTVSVSILIGTIAGFYPAIYLSKFQPIQMIRGTVSRGSRGAGLRSILVVIQFTISIMLISGTFIVYRQMNFILHSDVGFDKDQVLMIEGANSLGNSLPSFKEELLSLSGVKNVSISDYLPVTGTKRNGNAFYQSGRVGIDKATGAQIWRVDADYIKTMGMEILEGRDFSPEIAGDSQAVIINRSMARELDLSQPLGQLITNGGDNWRVIGVLKDFHYESMTEEIRPLCLVLGYSPTIISVKANTAGMPEVIKEVTGAWEKFCRMKPCGFHFWMKVMPACMRTYNEWGKYLQVSPCLRSSSPAWDCLRFPLL